MQGNLKYQVILHLIVLIWGTTGILGDYINLQATNNLVGSEEQAAISLKIVFYRTAIAAISLLVISAVLKKRNPLKPFQVLKLLGVGVIVGIHWFAFFYSIKISTVSIAVVCMSMSTLFTSLLEPLLFKRKLALSEVIISLFILAGIVIIFGFEFTYAEGIIAGLVSALFATFFTVLNGLYIKKMPSLAITKWEMIGAMVFSGVGLLLLGQFDTQFLSIGALNWTYLGILALVCTTFAFMVSVWVMKHVTPFTVSLSVNMEPIYTIILVLIIGYAQGIEKEHMSWGFYLGSAIIILSIFTNAYIKKRNNRKMRTNGNLIIAS